MFIPRRMHRSPAYRKLTKTSIFILMEFLYRRKVAKTGRKGGYEITNNGELIFTYAEAEKKFKIPRSTFCRSISQLVELGFIDINHPGGGMMKDCSKYGISDRWRDYGKEEFIKKSRQKDERKLGFQKKDWEKRTGRKRKIKPKISISDDTRSSIADDTSDPEKVVTSSITNATLKTDPNYYIQKGLEVLEAMYSLQYH
ncbi:MAG: hypothetical protein HOF21_13390 [Nitrospina sp.]|nr:hypothetical protein [Nitrospina sp.]